MWAFKCILFYILFFYSAQASMASNSDSDDSSVAMEIDFTIPGQTRTWPVGQDPDLLSSPPSPKESKEEERRRLKRESMARSRAAKKRPPKKKSKAAKRQASKKQMQQHRSQKRANSLSQEEIDEDARKLAAEEERKQRELAHQRLRREAEREATRQQIIREEMATPLQDCSAAPSTRFPAQNRPPAFTFAPPPTSQSTTATVSPENEQERNRGVDESDNPPSPSSTSHRATFAEWMEPSPPSTPRNSKTHQCVEPQEDYNGIPLVSFRTPPPIHFQPTDPNADEPQPIYCRPCNDDGVPFAYDPTAIQATFPTRADTPETPHSYREFQRLQKEGRSPKSTDVNGEQVSKKIIKIVFMENKTKTMHLPL
jgi:hypothetical protein